MTAPNRDPEPQSFHQDPDGLTREQLLENMVRVFIRAGMAIADAHSDYQRAVASMVMDGAVAAGQRLLDDA